MAQNPPGSSRGVVVLTRSAVRDKAAIYNYTAEQWSDEQADNYIAHLDAAMQQLALNPTLASHLPNDPRARYFIVRWQNSRDGHRIFFEETDTGILVLRILHTKMNWQTRMKEFA